MLMIRNIHGEPESLGEDASQPASECSWRTDTQENELETAIACLSILGYHCGHGDLNLCINLRFIVYITLVCAHVQWEVDQYGHFQNYVLTWQYHKEQDFSTNVHNIEWCPKLFFYDMSTTTSFCQA